MSRNCKTPHACGAYASRQHYEAMRAPVKRDLGGGGFWPSDAADLPITMEDDPPVTAEGVQLALADWLLWICAGVALIALGRWLYLNWWAISALLRI